MAHTELEPGGSFLGKFTVDKLVTTGSLGESVYKAEITASKRPVFIRILPPEIAEDKEFIDRFFQEIKLISYLNHPNILKALEAGKDDNCHYLVTSYSPGHFLDHYLKQRKKLDEPTLLSLIRSLAEALGYAWKSNKILHRYLSPQSIILTHKQEGVLTDFGLAKRLCAKTKALTMAGTSVGRPEYMSPEQFDSDTQIDCRADIYCLGMVAYLAITGQHPFCKCRTAGELIQAHLNENPEPISEINSEVSEKTATVIERMFKKKREERYQSWAEIVLDIDAIKNEAPLPSLQQESKDDKPQKNKTHKHPHTPETKQEETSKMSIVIIAIVIIIIIITAISIFLATKG